ncbi:MAG: glycosyltransferase family 2 protein [Solirubrobacterales bacterium]|nr:glycosyltransferase family 2 protein [Solirubrobacterales bacterium]
MAAEILIISPVRNEAVHIERVVRSVAAQELRPARWIVLDDNSTDGTRELLEALAEEVPFMEVHALGARAPHAGARDRLARAAAPRNFNLGLAMADWRDYTHVMKLDGDIELAPNYLRELVERFAADPRLGLAGGVLVEPLPDGFRRIAIPRHHVHGALKCYTRTCFESIGGVQERLGWDTIDETYARMRGFRTTSFEDLVSVHNRPWGSADGALRGVTRLGECAYITHYSPLWVAMRTVKLAARRPRGLQGAAYAFGYVRAFARRRQRVHDPEYRRFTRRELRQRLIDALTKRAPTTVAAAQLPSS